ncbi:hypothetical protein LUZ60_010277 [Juncus effusus]|nr:hypothetical protein LUZ60_010277 [Juncus effusus]
MDPNNSLPYSPDASTGMFSSNRIGGFGYGIGISVGILLLITTITLTSYFCTRSNTGQDSDARITRNRHRNTSNTAVQASDDLELGIDDATLQTYPEVLYSDARKLILKENMEDAKKELRGVLMSSATSACCSVCLADYNDTDSLRVLPDCGHMFHVACVDTWLRLRPTCPVCRTSPVPSPMPTPLAEVVPLTRHGF